MPLDSKVNAGPVSMYVFCKNRKTKDFYTKYMNELKPGDNLVTMNSNGKESSVIVEKNKINPLPMLYIKGRHMISGGDIFRLIDGNREDYFNVYRDIFHLKKRKTRNPVNVLDINKYKNKKKDICAYLDVATIVPDLNVKYKVGDKIMAYIQMPGLSSRHFGINYGGDNASCIER
jgi:3-dehydroquinate synthase class II